VFLDARWRRESVFADLQVWHPKLAEGGVFVFRSGKEYTGVLQGIIDFHAWLGPIDTIEIILSGGLETSMSFFFYPPCISD
jgi:hypothetical protein